MAETEALVDNVVRLRRVLRDSDDSVREELEPVLERLEERLGPTLNSSQTARLLGVSHTAIARWIKKGDIGTVLTPQGRKQIPVAEVLALLEQVQRAPNDGRRQGVAHVIRQLRSDAARLDLTDLLERLPTAFENRHERTALQSLMYHRLVARRLDDHVVSEARRRLRRWRRDGHIHPEWADEWEQTLAQPVEEVARRIGVDDEHARALRQSSPFAGALTEHERLKLLEALATRS
jgi:hypothetical protein